ncbi:MMPL family transporter [Cohnella faecalis]|nr:MMPL family transporter [Cohnella faecalis]
MEKWVKWTSRFRFGILALWLGLAAVSVIALPDLQAIVEKTEQKFLPADSESQQALRLLEQLNPDAKSRSTAVIVLSRDGGLKQADKTWMNDLLAGIETDKQRLGIASVLSANTQPELSERFVSKDGTTTIAMVNLPKETFEEDTKETVTELKKLLADSPEGAKASLTGSAPISQDFQQSSQDGLAKTELITVILVFVILLFVFRSPVAPFIPLITIGISVVISRGLIAVANDYGMPVSNFTQSFLIAVLFGAGTDYCILLIQRFREELVKDGDRIAALSRTMRGVGKTIFFSASTVFAAFFLIGFAKFGIYQSAVGVSIGVIVTLIAGVTLAPALLLMFGRAAFWPFRVEQGRGHGDSKLWTAAARFSAKRAGLIIAAAIVLLAPLTLLFQGKRSFDDIAEINPGLSSVSGFRQVEKAFGSGELFPVTLVAEFPSSVRTPEALAAIEQASAELAKRPDVQEVRSAVRPLGRQLTELTVSDQLGKTNDALGELKQGVSDVGSGLSEAQAELSNGRKDVEKLTDGLNQLATGAVQSRDGAGKLAQGLEQSRDGAASLNSGLQGTSKAVSSMKTDIDELLANHPELKNDSNLLAIAGKQQAVAEGLKQIAVGAAPLSQGLIALAPAARQLESGFAKLAEAQRQAAAGSATLEDGLGKLTEGLKQGADGLGRVTDGLDQVRTAQESIAKEGGKQIGGWVLPAEALNSEQLKQALDAYVSSDGKTAKFDVILKSNPYAGESMDATEELTSALRESLGGMTAVAGAKVYASGTTAQYAELRDISFNDFVRTGGLVLAGIALVLMLLLRSVLAPIYVLLSLGFNYFVTMGLMEFLFVKILGYPGLSWTVSFFVFLIIVALGVDYSIFLMARFKEEYRPGGVKAAMAKAMKTTGGVIVSAAVIMGGTFGAMGFSGVDTLVQIGVGTLIGLLLYATVFMALIVPSFSFLLGEANWWPFRKRGTDQVRGPRQPSSNRPIADQLPKPCFTRTKAVLPAWERTAFCLIVRFKISRRTLPESSSCRRSP